jgi:hypothetical protein
MPPCRWSRRRGLLLVAALSLTATACGNDGVDDSSDATVATTTTTTGPPTTTPQDTTTSASGSGVVLVLACTNPEAGYHILFPEGWSTKDGEVAFQCRYFHPHAFDVPRTPRCSAWR